MMPPIDAKYILEGRPRFPNMVRPVAQDFFEDHSWCLKPGGNNRKLGCVVGKGRWKGFPIYSLTLPERSTCPTCQHWRSCYGNHMKNAERFQPGLALELRLAQEVALLDYENPNGFLVRLHILGDFYSVRYVEHWRKLLDRHPTLNIWGYTARRRGDPIAAAVVALAKDHSERFVMRSSDDECDLPLKTVTIEHQLNKPGDDTVVCPAERIDNTATCATCGLCWETTSRIAFVQH
jgi:hypothetical protein